MKLIVGCSGATKLGKDIAMQARLPYLELQASHFPDGEMDIRFRKSVKGKELFLVQGFYQPNEKIIEVILAASTAKELGAKRVVLVAPYLCYMRQDKRFHPGESISGRIVAGMFNPCIDGIITIDPHLHRFRKLSEVYKKKTKKLTANALLGAYIKKNIHSPLVVGPDAESYQWALQVAKIAGCNATVLKKHRYTSESVRIKLKADVVVKGKNVVIVDDIISTGYTMMEVVKQAKRLGAKGVYCLGVHGLFVKDAYRKMKKLGVKGIVTCNTVLHPSNKISVAKLLGDSIRKF